MSPQVKVTWEEATRWIFRVGIGIAGLACVGALKIFNEVRDDVKTLLINEAAATQRLNDMDRRIKNIEDITKYGTGK